MPCFSSNLLVITRNSAFEIENEMIGLCTSSAKQWMIFEKRVRFPKIVFQNMRLCATHHKD